MWEWNKNISNESQEYHSLSKLFIVQRTTLLKGNYFWLKFFYITNLLSIHSIVSIGRKVLVTLGLTTRVLKLVRLVVEAKGNLN